MDPSVLNELALTWSAEDGGLVTLHSSVRCGGGRRQAHLSGLLTAGHCTGTIPRIWGFPVADL
jgi:hypothetical protein